MADILSICKNLERQLNTTDTKADILTKCVSNKLTNLYNTQSQQLDDILEELSNSIDTKDIDYTYRVIRKLSKCLSNNRAQLIGLIEEVNK